MRRNDEIVLEAGAADRNYWRDLWRYRELFSILAWRDVSVRYRQTVVGVLWAVMQPLFSMIVMTVVFGRLTALPSTGSAPYPIMVYAAMLPWTFFSSSLTSTSQSLVSNAGLVSKVYFPRMIIPGSAVVVSFVDFLVSATVLFALMASYGFWPDWRVLTLPLFVAVAFLAAIGPGLLLTALNVKYRDFRYVVPFIAQFGLYLSPVGFSSDVVREKFGEVAYAAYSLNPRVGVIEGFRWALLGGESRFDAATFARSMVLVLVFLVLGIRSFRRMEKTFADVI